jgi:hypothetical protein
VLVVDTVGFTPGILSADGRIPHSDRLHIVERFTLDAEKGALTRSFVADDPLYLQGEYKGSDAVYVADVPYEPTTCDDRSYKSGAGSGGDARWWLIGAAAALIAGVVLWLARSRVRPA